MSDNHAQKKDDFAPLTRVQAKRIFGSRLDQPRVTSMRVIIAQVLLGLGVSFFWKSTAITGSLFLGSMLSWFPSLLFMMVVHFKRQRIMFFVLAQILKIFATLLMLLMIVVFYRQVDWLALLIMYIVTLKTYWLAFLVK